MSTFDWLTKKTASSTPVSKTIKDTDIFREIHKLLLEKAKESKRECLSRNCILITADKVQLPAGVKYPNDNELITGLIGLGLISDCGLDNYRIADSV